MKSIPQANFPGNFELGLTILQNGVMAFKSIPLSYSSCFETILKNIPVVTGQVLLLKIFLLLAQQIHHKVLILYILSIMRGY